MKLFIQLSVLCAYFMLARGYQTCVDFTVKENFCSENNVCELPIARINHPCPAKCGRCERPKPTRRSKSLKDSCLQFINEKRSFHKNTPPMEWNYVHETDAQGCVQNLNDCLNNQVLYGYINLPDFGSYADSNEDICRMAIDEIYKEGKNYNYKDPEPMFFTDHFTQLVWRSTLQVGIGINEGNILIFFTKKGNVAGEYLKNVLPLTHEGLKRAAEATSSTTTTTPTTTTTTPKTTTTTPSTTTTTPKTTTTTPSTTTTTPTTTTPTPTTTTTTPSTTTTTPTTTMTTSTKAFKRIVKVIKKIKIVKVKRVGKKLKEAAENLEKSTSSKTAIEKPTTTTEKPTTTTEEPTTTIEKTTTTTKKPTTTIEKPTTTIEKPTTTTEEVKTKVPKKDRKGKKSKKKTNIKSKESIVKADHNKVQEKATKEITTKTKETTTNTKKQTTTTTKKPTTTTKKPTTTTKKPTTTTKTPTTTTKKPTTTTKKPTTTTKKPTTTTKKPTTTTKKPTATTTKKPTTTTKKPTTTTTKKPTITTTTTEEDLSDDISEGFPQHLRDMFLRLHNIRRVRHVDTAPLEYSTELEQSSLQWAKDLAGHPEKYYIEHESQDTNPYGENLYAGWGRYQHSEEAIEYSFKGWYDHEIKPYYESFKGEFDFSTGHFTAMVWRNTKKVGCAIARNDHGDKTVTVCRYDPPGNILSDIIKNGDKMTYVLENDQVGDLKPGYTYHM
ncbi:uncharacterized protein [Clytia hemisphaerica]|uniref:uncharacterized protein n=1 Tax=Clytia hemisphaerica TaxID=252671 RepID=UPI0034D6607F